MKGGGGQWKKKGNISNNLYNKDKLKNNNISNNLNNKNKLKNNKESIDVYSYMSIQNCSVSSSQLNEERKRNNTYQYRKRINKSVFGIM